MTIEELDQVKTMVLRELPRVLERDPGFAVWIEGLLSEKFPKRDEFARLLDQVEASRRENRAEFAKIDERFDQVDQRFAQVDQRFAQVDQRFVQVDQRFAQVDQRFDHLEQSVADVQREVKGLRDWMELNVGGFQTKAGRRLEDVVAGAFCYGLERRDITPEQVRLRQPLVDAAGLVWKPGRQREVDIITVGREILVFEVKSTADHDDIADLADKVTLVRYHYPQAEVQGVMVMLGAETDHRRWCAELGLRLIP